MAVNPNDPKVQMTTITMGTPNQRHDSLIGKGPLMVHSTHHLVVARPDRVPAFPNGNHDLSQHYYEYIFMEVLLFDDALLDRNLTWVLLPARGSRFLAHANHVGKLDWRA